MESSDYIIARYSPELRNQVLGIQTYLWGDNPAANDRYLEWKYFQNPFNKEILIYLARCGKEVVGMLGLYTTSWEVNGEDTRFVCLMAADAVVHPDHRRRGLISQLEAASLEDMVPSGHEFHVSLSAGRFSASALLSLGWRSAGDLQELYRRGRACTKVALPGRRIWSRAAGLFRKHAPFSGTPRILSGSPPVAEPFHDFDKNAEQGCRKDRRFSVLSDNTLRIDDMVKLSWRTAPRGRIQHVRNQDFFRWRFQNPFSSYRFICLDGERLEGCLVLQAPKKPKKAPIAIVDCHAAGIKVWSDLVKTAVEWCGDTDLMTWAATLSEEQKSILRKQGFEVLSKVGISGKKFYPHSLLLRPVHPDKLNMEWKLDRHQLLDLAHWHLQPIISDNF